MDETVGSTTNPVPDARAAQSELGHLDPPHREVGLYQAEVVEVGTENAHAKLKITELDNREFWAEPLDTTMPPPVGKLCWMMFVPQAAGEVAHLYTWAQPIAAELQALVRRVGTLEAANAELERRVRNVEPRPRLAKPQVSTSTAPTETTITVWWPPVAGAKNGTDGYTARAMRVEGGNTVPMTVSKVNDRWEATASGLQPDAQYDIRVVAHPADPDKNTDSPESNQLLLRTKKHKPDTAPLPKPVLYEVESARDHLVAGWHPVAGAKDDLDGYTGSASPTAGDGPQAYGSVSRDADRNFVVWFTDLQADTEYAISVIAHPADRSKNTDSSAAGLRLRTSR